jgi:hypothetical protein
MRSSPVRTAEAATEGRRRGLQRIPEWEELTQEERGNAVSRLDGLALEATRRILAGLKKLLARDYDINSTLDDLKRSIQRQGQERIRRRLEEERAKSGEKGPTKLSRRVAVPAKMTTAAELDTVIQQLHEIKAQVGLYSEIEVTFSIRPRRRHCHRDDQPAPYQRCPARNGPHPA